jgi:hypothetical protein
MFIAAFEITVSKNGSFFLPLVLNSIEFACTFQAVESRERPLQRFMGEMHKYRSVAFACHFDSFRSLRFAVLMGKLIAGSCASKNARM